MCVAGACLGQAADLPGFAVMRGADDPESISMVTAYERMVRGHLIGNRNRGISFLAYEVRLGRKPAVELFEYARAGWEQLVILQIDTATAICMDREVIESRDELAERIGTARQAEDALRQRIYEGAFEVLDEKGRERLTRYVAASRADITTSSYDIGSAITESQDSLSTMLGRVCAYAADRSNQ